jgi:hypothetical protein
MVPCFLNTAAEEYTFKSIGLGAPEESSVTEGITTTVAILLKVRLEGKVRASAYTKPTAVSIFLLWRLRKLRYAALYFPQFSFSNMGNAIYVQNKEGDIEIVDSHDKNIRKGTEQITKEQAQLLFDLVVKDITRSMTADGFIRMRPKHGKKQHTYRVQDKQIKLDFSRLYSD